MVLAAAGALVGMLAACGGDSGPLTVSGAPEELCVVARPDGSATLVLEGLDNALDRPVQVIRVDLEAGMNLEVEPAPDGWLVDPSQRTLEVPVRTAGPSTEGTARGATLVYTDGTEPTTTTSHVGTDIRVLPSGGDCATSGS
ncbi:hypothetical protein N867_12505 [Actinotalea fermentans ATCC 43279 = JCM 9966 = DSM 3133]|nr:hypothetical protein N867_12505 [Actinotalea fermentans ATCC 43279 = JCM 9966 = DSM 3133]